MKKVLYIVSLMLFSGNSFCADPNRNFLEDGRLNQYSNHSIEDEYEEYEEYEEYSDNYEYGIQYPSTYFAGIPIWRSIITAAEAKWEQNPLFCSSRK